MKKFIENSVDSVKFLAYNDIEAESLLRNLRSVMHNTKGEDPKQSNLLANVIKCV